MGLERISQLRKQKGLTIEELSQKSGIPISTIKKISAGITTNPNLDTVKAITKALGCKLDDLDSDESVPFAQVNEGKLVKETIINNQKFINLSNEAIEIAQAYESASPKEKNTVRVTLDLPLIESSEIAQEITPSNIYEPLTSDAEIDAEVEDYRRQLLEEREAAEKSKALRDIKEA